MKKFLLLAMLLSGCAVKAGNPGEGTQSKLIGTAVNMEDHEPAKGEVALFRGDDPVSTAQVDAQGAFEFSGLKPGQYVLVLQKARRTIRVEQDMTVKVLVPVPAAPGRARLYGLSSGGSCLLWDDRSGLEEAFEIRGAVSLRSPPNAGGVRLATIDSPRTLKISAVNGYGTSRAVVAVTENYAVLASSPVDKRRCTASPMQGDFLMP